MSHKPDIKQVAIVEINETGQNVDNIVCFFSIWYPSESTDVIRKVGTPSPNLPRAGT